jgi:hypothetical protein
MENALPWRLQCRWSTVPAPHEQILSIVLGHWQANALGMATKLGLADFLADGPLQLDELAKAAEVDPQALFRLLRALESIGFFRQTAHRTFTNSPASELLRKSVPGSQTAWIMHQLCKGNGCYEAWGEFEYTIRTGKSSVDKIYGYDFWEFLRHNSQANEAMNGAMLSLGKAMTPAITAAYDWGQFQVIADIGGGIGSQIVSILDTFPLSKGIVFDQPHVVVESLRHDRLAAVGGNFFVSAPPGADAYLLRFVLRDWSDEDAAAILRCICRAMKPSATLILAEWVVPEGPGSDLSKWTDLHMMVLFTAARERTLTEFRELFGASGFELEKVIATDSPVTLLVAKPTGENVAWPEQSSRRVPAAEMAPIP